MLFPVLGTAKPPFPFAPHQDDEDGHFPYDDEELAASVPWLQRPAVLRLLASVGTGIVLLVGGCVGVWMGK